MYACPQPSAWNNELGFQGGDGVGDYRDEQDGLTGAFSGSSVGDMLTGVVNGFVTDLPVLDGRCVTECSLETTCSPC